MTGRRRAAAAGASGSRDPAAQAWALMHRFVEGENRRGELAEALGFRLGGGRGKVLLQLRDGPATLSQLANRNGFDAPYATLVVDKLEAHGLVERRPHPGDRRRKLVTLTAGGHAAIATADAILTRPPAALSRFPESDLRRLAGLLVQLVEDTDEPADPAPRGRGERRTGSGPA